MAARKPLVIVTRKLPEAVETRMRELFDARLNLEDAPMSEKALADAVANAEILVPTITDRIDAALIAKAGPQLKLIANFGAGVDNIDVKAATDKAILVTNTPGVLTEDTADMTMALILAVPRRLVEGVAVIPDAHRREDLRSETNVFLDSLPASADLELAGGVRALLCHGLAENDMNNITADDYGYSLEANDELQALLRRGPLLVVKGHRHRHAIWRLGDLTLVDAGTVLSPEAPCAVVIDASARTIAPLRVSEAGVAANPAQPFSASVSDP